MNSVDSIAQSVGLSLEKLKKYENELLVGIIKDRFRIDIRSRSPWDKKDAPDGKFYPDGWVKIADYIGNNGCIFFQEEASPIWKIKNGTELRIILENGPAFEFYVCDSDANYLICFNYHDYIIGWGEAQKWIDSL